MSGHTGKAALACPSSVPIHDDGDMSRKSSPIDLRKKIRSSPHIVRCYHVNIKDLQPEICTAKSFNTRPRSGVIRGPAMKVRRAGGPSPRKFAAIVRPEY